MRSLKSVVAVISALMLLVDWLSSLFKEVKKLGGNEESVYKFFADKAKILETAEMIVVDKTKKLIQPLSDLITSLKLDWVNKNISEQNFPAQPEDLIETEKEYKEFHFGKTMTSENVIAEMNKKGFRPATTREQLKWAFKNWDGKSIIVALGQTWLDPGSERVVSVLHLGDGERLLYLRWFYDGWGGGCCFLGVRK